MKINIFMKTENGYKFYEVEAYPAFEMYGHKFLAHRGINVFKNDGRWNYIRQDWRVSEVETGSVLVRGFETFWDAIHGSEDFLKVKGGEQFYRAFERAKKEANGWKTHGLNVLKRSNGSLQNAG